MFGKKYTFDRIRQYRVLFHAENVFVGHLCPNMGQLTTIVEIYMLIMDTIRCLVRNINLTESNNIWCYFMLQHVTFGTLLSKNGTIEEVFWKYKGD